MNITIGDTVRDKITGFEGVVIAYTRWLSGCDRVTVQPRALKDGGVRMSEGFDVLQVELVEKGSVVIDEREEEKKTGGPRPEPQQWRAT